MMHLVYSKIHGFNTNYMYLQVKGCVSFVSNVALHLAIKVFKVIYLSRKVENNLTKCPKVIFYAEYVKKRN